jgi:dimeric dUTPase (all-alpha-NTP-PPase superfamily)
MRTLRIESGGRLIIGGEPVELSQIDNKTEFLSSLLTLDVELSEGLNVSDLIHFFYDAKDLIKGVLSEEYEVVRALVSTMNLPRNYKELRIYKSFKIEKELLEDDQEFIYLMPDIELVPSLPGEDGIRTLSSLRVIIDEDIHLDHKATGTNIKSKTKISLLDVMTCLFEDLAVMLKEGALLS